MFWIFPSNPMSCTPIQDMEYTANTICNTYQVERTDKAAIANELNVFFRLNPKLIQTVSVIILDSCL